jgi:hypothetical protein
MAERTRRTPTAAAGKRPRPAAGKRPRPAAGKRRPAAGQRRPAADERRGRLARWLTPLLTLAAGGLVAASQLTPVLVDHHPQRGRHLGPRHPEHPGHRPAHLVDRFRDRR